MGDVDAILASKNAILYYAEFDPDNALPANTVEWGTAWEDPWVDMGYTQDGVIPTMSVSRDEIVVDQILDPVLMPASGREITFASKLAEFTPAHLLAGLGQGTLTTTAPGVSTKGQNELVLDATISDNFGSWALDFKKPSGGEPMRIILFRGLATGEVEATFGDSSANAQIPFEVRGLPDDSVTPARILAVRDILPATA